MLLNEDFAFKGFEERKGLKYTGSYRDIFEKEGKQYFSEKYEGKQINHLDIREDFSNIESDLNNILRNILNKIDEKQVGFNFNKLKKNYIEFRYPGGNISKDVLKEQTLHYSNIVYLCCEPTYRQKDYMKKVYNFIINL